MKNWCFLSLLGRINAGTDHSGPKLLQLRFEQPLHCELGFTPKFVPRIFPSEPISEQFIQCYNGLWSSTRNVDTEVKEHLKLRRLFWVWFIFRCQTANIRRKTNFNF